MSIRDTEVEREFETIFLARQIWVRYFIFGRDFSSDDPLMNYRCTPLKHLGKIDSFNYGD